jgi:hypothetical protein
VLSNSSWWALEYTHPRQKEVLLNSSWWALEQTHPRQKDVLSNSSWWALASLVIKIPWVDPQRIEGERGNSENRYVELIQLPSNGIWLLSILQWFYTEFWHGLACGIGD